MPLYLKVGIEGGNTRLYRPDRSFVDVAPKKGSALFFRHGMDPGSVLREGRPVVGQLPKYVARINVLYDDPFGSPLHRIQ